MNEDVLNFRREVISQANAAFGGRDVEAGFIEVAGQMLEEVEELEIGRAHV